MSYAVAGVLGWFVSPYIAIALFVWMIVYHAVTRRRILQVGVERAILAGLLVEH